MICDYLSDHPIKCFYLPKIEIGEKGLVLNKELGSNQRFKIGDKVPYKTLYYNYGENFVIDDYKSYDFDKSGSEFNKDNLILHIIQNGVYVDTVSLMSIPQGYKIDLSIDVDGEVMAYKNRFCLEDIAYQWRDMHKGFLRCADKLLESWGLNGQFEDIKLGTENCISDLLNKIEELDARLYQKVLQDYLDFVKRFKSFNYMDGRKKLMSGFEIGSLYHIYLNHSKSDEELNEIIKEFEKKKEQDNSSVLIEIGKYKEWCKQNDIEVNIKDVLAFFEQYCDLYG